MRFKTFFVAVGVVAAMLVFTQCEGCVQRQQEKIAALEKDISGLKEEFSPMKFIVDYSLGKAKVSVKYYDQDGKEVGKKSFEMAGGEIFIDFKVVVLEDGSRLFFPFKVFSNSVPLVDGISLLEDYSSSGFPLIYRDRATDGKYDALISSYFGKVAGGSRAGAALEYGNAVHDLSDFGIKFKPKTLYKVVCHKNAGTGGIEFLRD